MPNFISEDQIEQALLQQLQHVHGYDVLACGTAEREDLNDGSGRGDKREVFLIDRLRAATVALSPGIPADVIDGALETLAARRPALSPVAANREVYELIRDGVRVEFDDAQGRHHDERVRFIDFETPASPHNRFLAVSQLWIKGAKGFRRPDVLLYVNGLPLVFIELKNSNVGVRRAFDDNLTTYQPRFRRSSSPTPCACSPTRLRRGSVPFPPTGRSSSPGCAPTMRRKRWIARRSRPRAPASKACSPACCPRPPLLDYVENFVLYHRGRTKIVAQNHRVLFKAKCEAVFNLVLDHASQGRKWAA